MIIYKKCSDVNIDLAYNAFIIGFSDYIIKLSISKEDFIKRFFGPEGNSLEYSHVALDGEKPIGVILGGIKVWEGVKTLRCGTLTIDPDYRGKGVSNKFMELHKKIAIENNCEQLFLEVIVGNDRAINFYKKLGYEKIYDLAYFSYENLSSFMEFHNPDVNIKEINLEEFKCILEDNKDFHINWQSDIEYVEGLTNVFYFVAYLDDKLVGYLCVSSTGKINFLWTKKQYRLKGISKSLLAKACTLITVSKLTITIPNNALAEGFLKHIGFKRDAISQYEMYKTL